MQIFALDGVMRWDLNLMVYEQNQKKKITALIISSRAKLFSGFSKITRKPR